MQIFELTQLQKSKLNEYDPDRSPTKPNYGTGVGPGVKTQMTVAPTVSGTSTAATTGNTINTADPSNPNIAAQTPYVQGRAGQGATPTRFAKYDPSTSSMANLDQGMQAMTTPAPAPSPANPNFGTGVGPGVKSQMTATPTVSGASTVAPTTPAPALANPNFGTGVGPGARPQMTATPTVSGASTVAPAPAPTVAPAPTPSQPTYNVPLAKMPATNTAMPSNMSTTGTPVASTTAGVDPTLAAASKVKMGAPQGRKANIGGAIANAMQAYNANKVGLGYLLPKDAKNEVYTDSTGKITIDGVPYDAANPEHQRLVGKITIGGKPYNGANPEHRAAYLAFKNTAGRGGRDTVKIDANGGVTVLGQPFDPANPAHVQEYRRHVLGSSVEQTPPPAPAQQPPAAQQPSDIAQALTNLGFTAQQSAAMAAKVPPGTSEQDAIKLGLAGKLNESLIWSRKFDPSATLLKKIKQL